MKFSAEDIRAVSNEVRKRMSEKRFLHTNSVLKAANRIGSFFESIDLSELSIAALLHDITKELPYEKQLELLEKSGVSISQEDRETPAVLHSLSAPIIIKRDFSKYATESILSSVKNHTMGEAEMSVFDRIVFIADYVEDSRSYESCKIVRKSLYDALSLGNSTKTNEYFLNKAIYDSIVFTENEVLNKGRKLNSKSKDTKEYFCKLLGR
jgi:predicted HD superfamily hydrolase involved in NAD metabolism